MKKFLTKAVILKKKPTRDSQKEKDDSDRDSDGEEMKIKANIMKQSGKNYNKLDSERRELYRKPNQR